MVRIEVKPNRTSEQCVCKGHNAKHSILVKGIYATPKAEILLCDECFKELQEKNKLSLDIYSLNFSKIISGSSLVKVFCSFLVFFV